LREEIQKSQLQEGRVRKKIAASGDLLDYLNLSVDRKTVQR
jgi:hypothetical protein